MIDLWAKNAFFRCGMVKLGHRNTNLNFDKNVQKSRFLTLCHPYVQPAEWPARRGQVAFWGRQETLISKHLWLKNDFGPLNYPILSHHFPYTTAPVRPYTTLHYVKFRSGKSSPRFDRFLSLFDAFFVGQCSYQRPFGYSKR